MNLRLDFLRNFGMLLFVISVCGAGRADAQTLTREQAVDALLDPTSGVVIDTTDSAAWCPFFDFGAGAGFEGLLPTGSTVDPATLGELPFPGPGVLVVADSYFFWIDDLPVAHFQHPVRFALVDANNPAPTVINGGIQLSDQGWWPVITLPGPIAVVFFDTIDNRVTPNPPGFANPEGLVAGPASSPDDIVVLPPTGRTASARGGANACGLILRGSNGTEFQNDVTRFENDLMNHYNVPQGRIVKANGGNAATKQNLCDAIEGTDTMTGICNMDPPCDKIYVRMTSHASKGSYCLADGAISKADLCQKFQKLAAKGVPICLVIEGCHTGSLLDVHNWNFPAGSSIITTADADHSSWGHSVKFTSGDGSDVTDSLYPHAFSVCLNDNDADSDNSGTVDDCEAHAWVLKQKPCYTWTANNKKYYPAGPPEGSAGANPNPQKRTVGRDPKRINVNVCNATGAAKTDFHWVFKGDVRSGTARAWRSTAGDVIGSRWADGEGETIVTYDEEKNETMVCWVDESDPVENGEYIHFGYTRPGGGLRPVRQYWTPTADPPDNADRAPGHEGSIELTPGQEGLTVRIITRDVVSDGWGEPVETEILYRVSSVPIPLDNLNLGDPSVADLTAISVGTFTLQPDEPIQFTLRIPEDILMTDVLIVESHTSWSLNGNGTIQLHAFDPAAALPIPNVSKWSLIIMTVLAFTAGTILFSRRRRAAAA